MDDPEVRQIRERMTTGEMALGQRPVLRPALARVTSCGVAAWVEFALSVALVGS